MDTPLVTILIATYNRADLIGEAISSAQQQTYTNLEIIVLDDASVDDTEKIVCAYAEKDSRIIYFKQKTNVGIAQNRNSGLNQARGKYIAILDSDDVWVDNEKLSKQVAFLEMNVKHGLVGTWLQNIDGHGKILDTTIFETDNQSIRKHILCRNQFAQSSLLYRTQLARDAGGYNVSYKVCDDYDLWLKIGLNAEFANMPEYMTGYRIHTGGITKTKKMLAAREHLSIIKKYKEKYPGYFWAFIKGCLRIVKATPF